MAVRQITTRLAIDGEQPGTVLGPGGGAQGEEAAAAAAEVAGRGEGALDAGWKILSDCFLPEETGIKSELINQYWPSAK